MARIHRRFCSGSDAVAAMLTVYIAEAHPADGWALPQAMSPVAIVQPRSDAERLRVAREFAAHFAPLLGDMPVVVDTITNEADAAYDAWPERLFVVVDGVVAFKSAPGPFGYRLGEVERFLEGRYPGRPIPAGFEFIKSETIMRE